MQHLKNKCTHFLETCYKNVTLAGVYARSLVTHSKKKNVDSSPAPASRGEYLDVFGNPEN